MKKVLLLLCALTFTGTLYAQAPADAGSCEAKAVDKNGKPLAGATKASSIKKCEKGIAGDKEAACEEKAVSKDGKPLRGAAKSSSVKKCMTE